MKMHKQKLAALLLAITIIAAPMSANARDLTDRELEQAAASTTTTSTKPKSTIYPHKSIKAWIQKYADNNKDVKGYLIVPGTNIAKPVAFNGESNKYYAYRDIKGIDHPNTTYKNFKETATYLDYRTKLTDSWKTSSRNTVIYGHNWTNLRNPVDVGSNNKHIMFGQLPSYTDIDFAKENPHIYFSTGENEGIWRVFSVAYVELDKNFNYNAPNPTKEEYGKLLSQLKDRSMFAFDVDVTDTDRILTLSTCTRQYDVGGQQRYIVVARLLRNGETEDDTVKVTVNKDMKKPSFGK